MTAEAEAEEPAATPPVETSPDGSEGKARMRRASAKLLAGMRAKDASQLAEAVLASLDAEGDGEFGEPTDPSSPTQARRRPRSSKEKMDVRRPRSSKEKMEVRRPRSSKEKMEAGASSSSPPESSKQRRASAWGLVRKSSLTNIAAELDKVNEARSPWTQVSLESVDSYL